MKEYSETKQMSRKRKKDKTGKLSTHLRHAAEEGEERVQNSKDKSTKTMVMEHGCHASGRTTETTLKREIKFYAKISNNIRK